MLRYIMDPADELRLADGVILVFSGARMMTFEVGSVRAADTVRKMPVDKTVQDALRLAAGASAITVSRPGAGESIPCFDEVAGSLDASR